MKPRAGVKEILKNPLTLADPRVALSLTVHAAFDIMVERRDRITEADFSVFFAFGCGHFSFGPYGPSYRHRSQGRPDVIAIRPPDQESLAWEA